MLMGCGDPSLRIGMTSTWRCHFEQSEKSLHCCHEKREPLIMLSCRNPRGTNFVCASRDHLLPALSIPAAFVATLCRDDKNGEHIGSPFKRLLIKQYTFILSPQSLCDSSSSTKRSTKSLCYCFDVLFGPLNIARLF